MHRSRLLGMRLLCCVSVTSMLMACGKPPHHDAAREEFNASASQLLEVIAEMESRRLDQEASGESFSLRKAAVQTVQRKGASFLRCETSTNLWLRINPDEMKWANEDNFEAEVAIYNPIVFSLETGKPSIHVGITFGGKGIQLSKAPSWEPLPLWEWEKW